MKRNKLLKHILYWLISGLVASITGHLTIELLQRIGFTSSWPHMELLLIGTAILFILYTFLSALLGSSTLGGIGLFMTALTVGIVNRVKIHYRADPLFPTELIVVKEVSFLIEMVGWLYTILIVLTGVILILIIVKFYQEKLKPKKEEIPRKIEWSSRILGVLISSLAIFYLNQFNQPDHRLREFYGNEGIWTFDNQLQDYQINGFVAGFIANLPGDPMDKPKGYSEERIQEIVAKYGEKADAMNQDKGEAQTDTNILFVMNESFSDPFNLEGIDSNKDPLVNFRRITKDTLSGQVLSPTFGGGTNANEFQALTGFSLEPLNPQITSPYMQLEDKIASYPTVVEKFNALNYRTTAIHPYDKNFFKRIKVYDKMGFAGFLHDDNMANTEKLSENHLFISDESAYKEAFEVLNRSEETDFIHVVTMQNHTPYADKYDEVHYQVTGSGNEDEAVAYFQDLENSDKALRDLIEEIDQHPEPILIVFWGDHLPGLYRGDVRGTNEEFTLRQTPFLVYSNTKDLAGEVETTSPIYFNNWLYDWLDFNLSAYDALLVELEGALPMIDEGMYFEKGEFLTNRDELSPEAHEVLEEYSLIMYDITTGEQYANRLKFFD